MSRVNPYLDGRDLAYLLAGDRGVERGQDEHDASHDQHGGRAVPLRVLGRRVAQLGGGITQATGQGGVEHAGRRVQVFVP